MVLVDLVVLTDQAKVVTKTQTVTVNSMTEITAKMVIIFSSNFRDKKVFSGDGPRGGGTAGHYNGYGNGDRRRRGGPRKPE